MCSETGLWDRRYERPASTAASPAEASGHHRPLPTHRTWSDDRVHPRRRPAPAGGHRGQRAGTHGNGGLLVPTVRPSHNGRSAVVAPHPPLPSLPTHRGGCAGPHAPPLLAEKHENAPSAPPRARRTAYTMEGQRDDDRRQSPIGNRVPCGAPPDNLCPLKAFLRLDQLRQAAKQPKTVGLAQAWRSSEVDQLHPLQLVGPDRVHTHGYSLIQHQPVREQGL